MNSRGSSVVIQVSDLIVMTQSCDLEHGKARCGSCCPIFPLAGYETVNAALARKRPLGTGEKRTCRGLSLTEFSDESADNREALVVDFAKYTASRLHFWCYMPKQLGSRWRLKSPFLEHFSQAFARFFMRVGLPSAIPPFK